MELAPSDMVTKHDYLALSIIALLILAGAVYSIYLGNDLRIWDEQEYVALAKNIVTKHAYSLDGQIPTALRPPGYPLALAFLVSWGAEVVHLRLFNIFLLGTYTWLLYSWLRRQESAVAGLFGIVMVVSYPVLLYSAGNLYPQTLGALLLLAALSILSQAKVTILQALLAGVLLGYLVLMIPTYRSRAIEFLVTNPLRAVQLYVFKVLNHFNFRNDLIVEPHSPLNPNIVMLLSYGGLLGLFLACLIFFRRLGLSSVEWLMITQYVSYAFVQAFFFTRIRFRLPFDFLLIALDAVFVHHVARETRKLIHV